jgi:hypothetical protein
MTSLQKLSIILIILLMVFGFFTLLDNPDFIHNGQPQMVANHFSTSVAWLGVCGVFLTYQLVGSLKT